MELEPLQSTRSMEVDLGAGLGDDLGGFDALDELFAPSNTPDFFKSSTLDNGTQAAVTAPPSPGSSGTSSSWLGEGEGDFAPDDWHQQAASMRRENVKLESIRAVRALTEPAMHVRNSKPRARKRHDEDEALKAIETAHPSIKVRETSGAIVSSFCFHFSMVVCMVFDFFWPRLRFSVSVTNFGVFPRGQIHPRLQ